MSSDQDLEIIALVELPEGVLEGTFQADFARTLKGRHGIVGKALWGLLIGVLKNVPVGVPFNISVLASGCVFTGPEFSSEMLGRAADSLLANAYTWAWRFLPRGGKEVT